MTATAPLARTPLNDWHSAHGARLVDFAGWSMPVQYGSIVDEHHATRNGVGLFDVSHMGRLTIAGADAAAWLDRMLTRRVLDLKPGQVRYSLVCNAEGGVLDDVLVARTANETARYELVVNAANRAKLLEWFAQHGPKGDADLRDVTEATAMIAVQGPKALALAARLSEDDPAGLKRYRGATTKIAGFPCTISRTGYTGEDGIELICPADAAPSVWQALVDAGGSPCGLAARDTLRLEAGMPLYGHELSESINPLQAGLGFAVALDSSEGSPRDFLGAAALRRAAADNSTPKRVGLEVEGRRPPREGYRVLHQATPCGEVTSGAPSPTLGKPIAMAYVDPQRAATGTKLSVDIRGTEAPAVVVPLPFYRREPS